MHPLQDPYGLPGLTEEDETDTRGAASCGRQPSDGQQPVEQLTALLEHEMQTLRRSLISGFLWSRSGKAFGTWQQVEAVLWQVCEAKEYELEMTKCGTECILGRGGRWITSSTDELKARRNIPWSDVRGWSSTDANLSFRVALPNNETLLLRTDSQEDFQVWREILVGLRRNAWSTTTEADLAV